MPKRMACSVMLCAATLLFAGGEPLEAQPPKVRELSAEWWQWALSIPSTHNPLLDPSGQDCMVGQRGDTWFLAGVFGGGDVSRARPRRV